MGWNRGLSIRRRWLIVGKNLIDAQDDVGEQKRALHWVTSPTDNTPRGQYHSTGDGYSDQSGVDVRNFRKLQDAPEKVYGARYDRRGQYQETNLDIKLACYSSVS